MFPLNPVRSSRLRWQLHELDPGLDPQARRLGEVGLLDALATRLSEHHGMVAPLAGELIGDVR